MINIDVMRERAWRIHQDHGNNYANVIALCDELDRLRNPAPIDGQRLREVGFVDQEKSTGLHRHPLRAEFMGDSWKFNLPDGWARKLVNPQPQCMGDVFQLIERVERGAANG